MRSVPVTGASGSAGGGAGESLSSDPPQPATPAAAITSRRRRTRTRGETAHRQIVPQCAIVRSQVQLFNNPVRACRGRAAEIEEVADDRQARKQRFTHGSPAPAAGASSSRSRPALARARGRAEPGGRRPTGHQRDRPDRRRHGPGPARRDPARPLRPRGRPSRWTRSPSRARSAPSPRERRRSPTRPPARPRSPPATKTTQRLRRRRPRRRAAAGRCSRSRATRASRPAWSRTTTSPTRRRPFAAHVDNRDQKRQIARQYLHDTKPDVILGGGEQYWYERGTEGADPRRPPRRPAAAAKTQPGRARRRTLGYQYAYDAETLAAARPARSCSAWSGRTRIIR